MLGSRLIDGLQAIPGLRLLGPAHYGTNRYAGGTGTELPLTPRIGPALLKEMRKLGIANLTGLVHFAIDIGVLALNDDDRV